MAKPQRIVDFEQQYREIYDQMIADGGGEFMRQVERDFLEAARKQNAYGTNGADTMANAYIVSDYNAVRKARNQSYTLPQEQQKTADTVFSYMDELIAADNDLTSMKDYAARISEYYSDQMEAFWLSDAERELAEQRYNRVNDFYDELSMLIPEYKDAKAYNIRMMDRMMGRKHEDMKKPELVEQEQAWKNAMEDFGISHKGLNPEESARTLKEEMRAAVEPELTAVVMNVESSAPDLANAFLNPPSNLTTAQKGFAAQNFDLAFHDGILSKERKKALEKEGKDIFDLIYVNGQSMNELYGNKYASSSYYDASEMMKCEFMHDLLNGKQIDLLLPGEEPTILPIQVKERANSGLDNTMQQRIREVSQIDRGGHHYAAEIAASQNALEQRSPREIRDKRERMQENKPMYSQIPPVEPSASASFRLPLGSEERRRLQFSLRENAGQLAAKQGESEQQQRTREALVSEGEKLFEKMKKQMGIAANHELHAQANIEKDFELFYIDGKPALEYVQSLHPDMNLELNQGPEINRQTEALICAEIASAALSGKHYVEAAKVGMDEKGNFQVGIVQAVPEMRSLDGQEGFFQTKPSKQMDKLIKNDKNKAQRQADIQRGFSEKLASGAMRALREREAQKEPHAAAYKRMGLKRINMTEEYFDAASLQTLQEIPSGSSMELPRGNFGGYRTYAQLLLMARHPEVRFADLMNPEMYREEKLAAGREVAQAFSTLYAGPNPNHPEDKAYLRPAAELMKTGMEVMAKMDVRKELLYALGEPDTKDPAKAKAIMGKPENLPEVSGFLRAMSNFSVNTFQALGRVHGRKDVSVSTLDPAKAGQYPPIYAELTGMVTPELVSQYAAANRVTRAMNVEKSWNEGVFSYAKGEHNPVGQSKAVASRLVADQIRDQIAEYGRASAVPNVQELLEKSQNTHIDLVAERLQKAVESGKTGLSVGTLMTSSVDASLRDQILAEARIASVVQEKGSNAMWADVVTKSDNALLGGVYFRNNEDSLFADFEKTSKIKTIARDSSRGSAARIYMMGVQGASLKEATDPKNAEGKLAAGDGFIKMMQEHQFHNDMSPEDANAVARVYGNMYHNAAQKMLETTIADIDWKDPFAAAAACDHISAIANCGIDYSQTQKLLDKYDGFVEAYGGAKQKKAIDDKIDAACTFMQAVKNIHDVKVPLAFRVSGAYMVNACAKIFNGRSLNDLTEADLERVEQVRMEGLALGSLGEIRDPKMQQGLEDYIAGKTPLPEDVQQRMDMNMQMFERTKTARERKAPTAQAAPAEQGRVRVGLDGVQRAEAAVNPRPNAGEREQKLQERRELRQQARERENKSAPQRENPVRR